MSVKLARLQSGEDVIADVHEMILDEKPIGYFFNKPCLVGVKSPVKTDDVGNVLSYDIVLSPWIPFAKKGEIPVPLDWVVTLVEPIDQLVEMYETDVLNYDPERKTDGADEQPNLGLTD